MKNINFRMRQILAEFIE